MRLDLLETWLSVLPSEAIDAARRIDEALLTGVERMTCAADVHGQLGLGRVRLERAAARATDGDDLGFGVDAILHNRISRCVGEADGSAQR